MYPSPMFQCDKAVVESAGSNKKSSKFANTVMPKVKV